MSPKVTLITLVLSVLFAYAVSSHDVNNRSKRNAQRRRQRARLLGWFLQMDSDMSQYIPDVPTAGEVDCHFDNVEILEVGGHCVRLGGTSGSSACQSGIYLDVHNTQCEGILRGRELQPADTSQALQQAQNNDESNDK